MDIATASSLSQKAIIRIKEAFIRNKITGPESRIRFDFALKGKAFNFSKCEHCGRHYSICCICDEAEKRWKSMLEEVREVSQCREEDPKEVAKEFLRSKLSRLPEYFEDDIVDIMIEFKNK